MEVNERKAGNFLVLDLNGRLDTTNFGEFETKLVERINHGEKQIVVNCSDLTYISSSGLRVFLMALKKMTASNGKFYLCCLRNNIREIFEITGFTTFFNIFDTLEEALN